jgi:SAM-dependent methyltransferase
MTTAQAHDPGHTLPDTDTPDRAGSPRIGDAIGETLTRCWQAGGGPGAAYEILERIDGCVFVADASYYFAGPDAWAAPERWACGEAYGRVLDVGCGGGRHAVLLQDRGLEVVGIDRSPGAVRLARERGVDALEQRLGHESGLGTFDTILLLGNNFGLLQSRAAAPALLRRLATLANPGAQILGSSVDPSITSAPEHLSYHAWNRANGRLPSQQRIRIRGRTVSTPWFDYLHLSAGELAELTSDSPWAVEHVEQDGVVYAAQLRLRA